MSSTKRPFYDIFTHSHHTKIIKIAFKNPLKALKNKDSIELSQNLQKILLIIQNNNQINLHFSQ